jgi:hypothetical protein
MEDIWESVRSIGKKVWIRTRKRCVDIYRQNLEATMREGTPLTLHNSLMNN